ncbi:plasmid recombination protein [Rhodobacter sp. KR11]|uniref:plasmid recombination protein n=1 Tax=Rhodobacter sp. KR11 TaxID=2974588 RepID=UPI00222140F5|nr:plasmid recombination protein [Rhodobacter sp. KR11]MCW1918054.1 plasmid recombination protein [Rhodobacter sp. KR11]
MSSKSAPSSPSIRTEVSWSKTSENRIDSAMSSKSEAVSLVSMPVSCLNTGSPRIQKVQSPESGWKYPEVLSRSPARVGQFRTISGTVIAPCPCKILNESFPAKTCDPAEESFKTCARIFFAPSHPDVTNTITRCLMTAHTHITDPNPSTQSSHPAVLTFKKLHPKALGKFRMHDERRGGDLAHVDVGASAMNEVLHGGPRWIDQVRDEVREARMNIHLEHVAALRRKSRHRDADALAASGPSDPWRRVSEGPLREGILTVNKAWFGGSWQAQWDPEKVLAFKQAAMAFLRDHFPDDQLRYVSAHHDEEAFHIHFVVLVWNLRISENRSRQRLIESAANPLLANYEHAQDLIGMALQPLGICRGIRRAEERRHAKWAGLPADPPRRHVPPSMYRQTEISEGRAEAARIIAAAREEANAMMAAAQKSTQEMARAADEARGTDGTKDGAAVGGRSRCEER